MNELATSIAHIPYELNEPQKDAVFHDQGSLLVIAGAGSGKTRVITARIIHLLIHHHVSAHAIVALTFTNKAAQEMKERIAHSLPSGYQLPFIGTFHAYCVQLLKKHSSFLAHPFLTIIDADDQKQLVQTILERHSLNKQLQARNVCYQISQLKNSTIEHSKQAPVHFSHPLMHQVYEAYEEEKRASKCLDFDDLLIETVQLLKHSPQVHTLVQQQLSHILVDEYQDTNLVQKELLKTLALHENALAINSVCAVGDEDQSIYSWRGATVSNIINFGNDFPHTRIIKIEQNYRSIQPILDIANSVIAHNSQRNPKQLWSARKSTRTVHVISAISDYQEAAMLVSAIKAARKKNKSYSIAVLYRTHAQSRVIEETLIKHSLPYKIIGGTQFYERKEIKDILAHLRLIANPFDHLSLMRIINTPLRGLGAQFEGLLSSMWQSEPFLNYAQLLEKIVEQGSITPLKKRAVQSFLNIFASLDAQSSATQAVTTILEKTAYIAYLKDTYDQQEADSRIANVQEFLNAVVHLETEGYRTVEQLIDAVALMQEKASEQSLESETVLLMTLHAAKGLEFDVVLLCGLEEEIIPTSRALADDDAIEEERRLFYVGITRAKEHLLFTHAQHRRTYGQLTQQMCSRFIREIPSNLVHREDGSMWSSFQLNTVLEQWTAETSKKISSSTVAPARKAAAPSSPLVANKSSAAFRKNQIVFHAKYGTGLVQQVETKMDGSTQVTVQFKYELKKILASFLEAR